MNLYQIDDAIMDCLDMESGEVIDEERLATLQMERDKKIRNIALWYKNLIAEAKALKDEEAAFKARKESAEKKADSLKRYLQSYLGGEKIKETDFVISYRTSKNTVKIDDEAKLPDAAFKMKKEVSKTQIKEMIMEGIDVQGAHLEDSISMQIK